jgi:hypothetical protein
MMQTKSLHLSSLDVPSLQTIAMSVNTPFAIKYTPLYYDILRAISSFDFTHVVLGWIVLSILLVSRVVLCFVFVLFGQRCVSCDQY